jgi:hypothetical protein
MSATTEKTVWKEARRLFNEDRQAGLRHLQPDDSIPEWNALPAHHQAVYVRYAARGLGYELPEELEAML